VRAVNSETVTLTSADGVHLTADVIDHAGAVTGVVVAHPHPLYGGDRHNHVVDTVWRAAGALGACAVRFDFRGAGDSQGRHGGGAPEQHDVRAAVAEVRRRHPGIAVWLVGYSFGALVAGDVDDPGVAGWLLIAPPLSALDTAASLRCGDDARPCTLVVPQHDEFCPPACVEARTTEWAATRSVVLASATHSMVAQSSALVQLLDAMIAANSSGPTPQQPPM